MVTARRDWDAIVIGLGGIGSGAAYWLSRTLGDGVLGLEQFELDHVRGASADHSRIIRLSYHRPAYVRLARRAYESWAVVEAESEDRIVTVTGGLDLWPDGAAIPKSDYTESLTAEGVPYELLDAAEVRHRWPQWRIGDDVTVEVAMPRMPCTTFQAWMAEPHWVKRFTLQGAPGAYLRVLDGGPVEAGQPITVVHRPAHGVTIGEAFAGRATDPDRLRLLLEQPDLAGDLVAGLRKTLGIDSIVRR